VRQRCLRDAQDEERSKAVRDSLVAAVREQIGAFAAPDVIHWAPGARARSPEHGPGHARRRCVTGCVDKGPRQE
jgi:hypothetical protein